MSVIEIIDGVDRSKIFGRVLWNDINIQSASFALGAVAPDTINFFGAGGIRGLGFDGNATTERIHSSGEILHGYLEGSDIEFHVHWMPTTANAGNVKWQIEYTWINVDGTFSNPTTLTTIEAAGGTEWHHHYTDFVAIDGTGREIGSAIVFSLFRDPTDGEDTYSDDAAFIQLGIHYQVDVYGSRQELIK